MAEAAALLMEEAPAVVYIFVFLFGIVVGSFLNVCIYRLPKHESIVVVPSHCMTCGKKLHWYELFPLFSWLALRGKCLGCKAPISPQYPIIEASNGVLWLAAVFVLGLTPDAILCQLLLSTLLVIAIIDARTKEIPFSLNIFIGVLALIRLALHYTDWKEYVIGLGVIGGLFLIIFLVSGGAAMGGGDVKLMIACGLFLGIKAGIVALVIACISACVIHLILMKVKHLGRQLAFGPYLAGGIGLAALWGTQIASWYLNTFFTF